MKLSAFQAARHDSRSRIVPVLSSFRFISCLPLLAPVAVPHSKGKRGTLPAVLLRFLLFGLKQPAQYFLKAHIGGGKQERKQLCAVSCA